MTTRWRQQSRPLDQRGLPVSATSFIVPIIIDEEFSPEKMVFLVYNHADAIRKRDPLSPFPAELVDSRPKKGKPAGFGLPGGGVNPEHLENSEHAAIREGRNESGLKVTRVRLIKMPEEEKNKILILNKRTEELVRWTPYKDGQQPKVEIRPGEKAILNPLNYYLADVDWPVSKPREFFINLKNELLGDGACTAEDIAKFGLSVNTLTRDELLGLGVNEEEVAEIGGFALLPISYLRWMWENKWFFLDPEEDQGHRKNNSSALTSYIYYSHIKRLIQILDITGVA